MERSRRPGERRDPTPPATSKLTFRPKRNRRRPGSLWSRLPRPGAVANACGKALRRSLPAMLAVAALAALGGTAYAGYRFVTHSSRFAITEIAIRGAHHLDPAELRATLPVHVGDNVFTARLDGVVTALRANPWVVSATAHRVLPHTIEIAIEERAAAAAVDLGGLYLVDGTGHPFKRALVTETAGLPVITGLPRDAFATAPDATATVIHDVLGAYAAWRSDADRPAIGELHIDVHGGLVLEALDQPLAIQLGPLDGELHARIETFDAVWAELGDAERARSRTFHLDARPDHVTVAFARN
jgi:cell division protein FtsQ